MSRSIKTQDGKNYIEELYNAVKGKKKVSKRSLAWIEGWICGFTDTYHNHQGDDKVRQDLLGLLKDLQRGGDKS